MWYVLFVNCVLNIPCGLDTFANRLTGLIQSISAEFFIVHTRNFDVNIDEVKDGTGDALLVFGHDGRGTGTGLLTDIDLQSAPWWYIVSEGLGVVTDMQLDVEFYPVETKIHWQLKESGLWITNVELYNFLPDVVRWEDVHFSAPFMGNTIEVSESLGINDSTSVDLNFQPYTNVDTTMEIRMRADGSFPPNASVAIVMPSGAIPPAGCSILR